MIKPLPYVPLTVRQAQVRDLVLKGMSTAEISKEVGLTRSGVNYNLTDIYKKYKVKNRIELLLKFNQPTFEDLYGDF